MNEESTRQHSASLVAAATAGGIIAQQVAGKAVRDALFLSSFHATSLPRVMAAAAILSLGAVLWLSRVLSRRPPRRVLPVVFAMSGIALVLEWALIAVSPAVAAVAVYLHVGVVSPIILSVFWSLINEQFDPHTAKAAVARIASGGAFGGVLGGLGAWRLSSLVPVPTMVLILAGVNVLCLVGTVAVAHSGPAGRPTLRRSVPPERLRGQIPGLAILRTAPYIRNLALLVMLGAAMSCLLDYVFSAQVTASYGRGPTLFGFFALFGLVVSAVSLVFQLTLGRLAMEKLGLAVNIAVLPGIIILGGAAGLAVPGLISVALLRGAEMVQRNTLFRSAYELLYTPLEEKQKRATKALVDVGFDRLGTVSGSAIAIVVLALSSHNQGILLGVVVFLAFTTLPIARQLHRGYVSALAERLRDGERALELHEPETSRSTQVGDDAARDAVIRHVERARKHEDPVAQATTMLADPAALARAVDDLASREPDRVRRALTGWDRSKLPLAGFAIALLADRALHRDVRDALRSVADRIVGQLLDALLDPELDFTLRRRIPSVLAACSTQRAADGLLLGLADERFEVRYASGRALLAVTGRAPNLVFARDTVIQTLLREIARATSEFEELEDESDEEPNPLFEVIARDRVSRSVETFFVLLSLILDREPLQLCFRALHQSEGHHRGTALEYLQTVLPAEARDALLPLLNEAGPIPAVRPAAEILSDLRAAMSDAGTAPPSVTPSAPREAPAQSAHARRRTP